MAISEQFRQELQRSDLDKHAIARALTLALTEMIELDIHTWVVPTEEDPPSSSSVPGYRMKTHINIVDGDITNEVGSAFLANGPYAELRDFHLHQVADSRVILQQNLETLQQIFTILAGTLHQLSPNNVTVPAALPPSRS